MKNTILNLKIPIAVLTIIIALSCSKDDGPAGTNPEPENSAPEAFGLIGVTDGAVGVDVFPSFSWEEATDPDGDAVSYNLYLGTESNPSTQYASGINGTSLSVAERLRLVTHYDWKVKAKDGKGGEVESQSFSFTTRNLNLPATRLQTMQHSLKEVFTPLRSSTTGSGSLGGMTLTEKMMYGRAVTALLGPKSPRQLPFQQETHIRRRSLMTNFG